MRTLRFFAGISAFFSLALASAAVPTVSHSLRGEPPQLNSMKATDLDSSFVLGHVLEGLVRYGEKADGGVVPGVAEKWKLDDKGATFWLRKSAKWSDGTPVVARDFIFA